MELKDLLVEQIETLGQIRFSNSFGWICVYTGKNLFAGYKVVDNNILLLWLILSPDEFKNSLDEGFIKFDFGKTWAEIEITGEDDIQRIIPFLKNAFDYSKEREQIKKLK
ncbi:MAG: hypothetical protein A3B38_00740 [Candidatus Levybacteria bacterium RIFCSPLOWO2_01_FULL_36_13]|nr:MAG: hypothetical protein A2684_01980 [Candidatus Levybacteria bacterium RIFCSPHIGHO2_01_FULL_36_15b]OGH35415.1 MAG: hypothetical protein A3B38_00740 [Candidatus Levybacteria bacterium RIFCSPLOWO2_01_FULL_36_13]